MNFFLITRNKAEYFDVRKGDLINEENSSIRWQDVRKCRLY
ncbi:MAG: hypothetical protein A370_04856 [Clostridium sp. Maddingley MBC34-26]|nr:MAG: hypothetical protein A370_04856 [Clostridium sp. Maddingley MBC34-26]